jgi:hypothetical protein
VGVHLKVESHQRWLISQWWNQAFWTDTCKKLKSEYQQLIEQFLDADAQLKQVFKVICNIEEMARYTPTSVGGSEQRSSIIIMTEENKQNFCKVINGKNLLSALYGTYTIALHELKPVLRAGTPAGQSKTPKSAATQEDGFKGVRTRKQHSTNQTDPTSKKAVPTAVSVAADMPPRRSPPRISSPRSEHVTWTRILPTPEASPHEATAPVKTGQPSPIVLTSAVNLIQLQKQLKGVVSENIQFRTTKNRTRAVMRSMADFQSVKSHFDSQNLSYYSFPKPEKPIKAVIRHLPQNLPAEDISDGLVSLGFDVVSVKQMIATHRSPTEESKFINLPLYLVTLAKEIFGLPSLCHTAIRVEAYRAQNALTQCNNCQQLGHIWTNCKQLSSCLWYGGGLLHKDCPKKENTASTPTCYNCQLAEKEKAHTANYRGCRHAKEQL